MLITQTQPNPIIMGKPQLPNYQNYQNTPKVKNTSTFNFSSLSCRFSHSAPPLRLFDLAHPILPPIFSSLFVVLTLAVESAWSCSLIVSYFFFRAATHRSSTAMLTMEWYFYIWSTEIWFSLRQCIAANTASYSDNATPSTLTLANWVRCMHNASMIAFAATNSPWYHARIVSRANESDIIIRFCIGEGVDAPWIIIISFIFGLCLVTEKIIMLFFISLVQIFYY